MKKYVSFLLLLMIGGWPVLNAQDASESCELYNSMPGISDCYITETTYGFTFGPCRARIEVDTLAETVSINGRVFSVEGEDSLNFVNYLSDLCSGGTVSGFTTGSYTDPVVGHSLKNLFVRTLSNRLVPKEVKAEGMSEAAHQLTGSVGTGTFDANGVEGRNSDAQFGYVFDWESGYTAGSHVTYNKLTFDTGQYDLTNASVNLFMEKSIDIMGFEGVMGAGYNHLLLDERLGDDGQGLNFYLNGSRDFGKHQFTGDVQYQYTKSGELEQQMATFFAAYGMPIGNRGALNGDVVLVKTEQSFNGQTLPGDDFFGVAGLAFDYYLGGFVIKMGARKVFTLDGYSNLDFTFGGGLRY